jgi:hypothetical protein
MAVSRKRRVSVGLLYAVLLKQRLLISAENLKNWTRTNFPRHKHWLQYPARENCDWSSIIIAHLNREYLLQIEAD